eukprot:1183304-Prorocentrum_minimum.AAC.3
MTSWADTFNQTLQRTRPASWGSQRECPKGGTRGWSLQGGSQAGHTEPWGVPSCYILYQQGGYATAPQHH